ncbi:glycosyltransferase family 2 protein [Helicobacter kayseriensis]|uniref:glycosyltransferase family 2 protein n=1 Tax=Helicobacter kayseriensis TaxID=2905877 RepID=UPI001E287481|nr:glycosyltransferase family A protein [Helicobacter kayseriensis]MCE3047224.1 glycosyltransferase family 2 protein [Helicobacter kayseriensis]MCE3048595.1 glycosyltransferase family 2 protein [Helicobacter kayseriensis]
MSSLSAVFFSVIIPTFNREDFISRAIDSVLCQDFENFELIVVDDGSTDRTRELLEQYNDERIRYFYKANGGVSSARNLGLQHARGQYVTFIDSDDYIAQGFLKDAYSFLSKGDIECLFYAGVAIQKTKEIKVPLFWAKASGDQEYVGRGLFIDFCLYLGNSWGCGKFFKNSAIQEHHLQFCEEISYGEDLMFVLSFLAFAQNSFVRNKNYYYCDIRYESLSRSQISKKDHIENLLKGYEKLRKLLIGQQKEELLFFLNTIYADHIFSRYCSLGALCSRGGNWEKKCMALFQDRNQDVSSFERKIRQRVVGINSRRAMILLAEGFRFCVVLASYLPDSIRKGIKSFIKKVKIA